MRRADRAKQFKAAKRRVIRLANAIADLNKNDLRSVLGLDAVTPLIKFGENDSLEWSDDGILYTVGYATPATSLRHKAGEALGRVLERQLLTTLVFAEGKLITRQKPKRGKRELGGRSFS